MTYATIQATYVESQPTGHQYRYMLVDMGTNGVTPLPDNYSGTILISRRYAYDAFGKVQDSGVLTVGQYRLRIIKTDYMSDGLVCVLDRPVNWLTIARYDMRLWLTAVYYRLIMTAWVWGLAKRDPAVYPSWRDVYILHWLFGSKRK